MIQIRTRSTSADEDESLSISPGLTLLIAIWLALGFSVGEIALDGIRKLYLDRIIGIGPDLVWMIPVADLFFFLVPGLVIALILFIRSKPVLPFAPLAVLLSLGLFSWLILTPLHLLAQSVLAVGLGIQLARVTSKRFRLFVILVKRSVLGLVLLVIAMTAIAAFWRSDAERRMIAELPDANVGSPNVLLIVLDTVRAQNMSAYGFVRDTTPNLEKLAGSGVLFEHPIAPSPWTLPSHASMFTGRWHGELSTDWSEPLDATFPTIAEGLRNHGYLTAGFVANAFYGSYEHGLNRGFVHYEDFERSFSQALAASTIGQTVGCWRQLGPGCYLRPLIDNYELLGRKNAAEINEDFLDWLDRQDDRPFFAFLNYFDAHAPYLPPEPFATKFGPERAKGHPVFVEGTDAWTGSDEELQYELDAYDGAIAYLDYQLARLFDALDRRGLRENTLLIITSDHGEEFREHAVMSHGNSLYRQGVEVPLLMVLPDVIPARQSVEEPVSLRNLPATIVHLTGLEKQLEFPGTSLARYWGEGQDPNLSADPVLSEVNQIVSRPSWYPIVAGDMASAVFDGIRIIQTLDGEVEMYDFHKDPLEQNPLPMDNQGHLPALGKLHELLEQMP